MTELHREPDLAKLGLLRSILESRGIATLIRNENEFSALGISRLAPAKHEPVLCVMDEADYEEAMLILGEHLEGEESASRMEIACASCGEPNPGNFEICWSCGGVVRSGP